MTFKSYRDQSRINWGREMAPEIHPTREETQHGAILRIADACELMAKNHAQLVNERDSYKRRYESEQQASERLRNSNAALRGVIMRMKRKAKP